MGSKISSLVSLAYNAIYPPSRPVQVEYPPPPPPPPPPPESPSSVPLNHHPKSPFFLYQSYKKTPDVLLFTPPLQKVPPLFFEEKVLNKDREDFFKNV